MTSARTEKQQQAKQLESTAAAAAAAVTRDYTAVRRGADSIIINEFKLLPP